MNKENEEDRTFADHQDKGKMTAGEIEEQESSTQDEQQQKQYQQELDRYVS